MLKYWTTTISENEKYMGPQPCEDAAAAAAAVFESFGGVEGYTTYLRNEVKILGRIMEMYGEYEGNISSYPLVMSK